MTDRDLIAEARKLADDSVWPVPDRMIRPRGSALMSIVRELADALEAKHTQHAETLGYLDRAYEVIEAARRPSLGYVAIARTSTDRLLAYSRIHSTGDAVREWGRGKKIVIAELREVPDA